MSESVTSEGAKQGKAVAALGVLGPGLAMAATGVGAGDMVAAVKAGADFGTALLWGVLFGAVLKFFLNEGLARWQLATGTTLLEGWVHRLWRPLSFVFVVYLVLWSFIVAGALISATGLAAEALFGQLSWQAWGILHSFAAVVLVVVGRYGLFENLMKVFIGLMFGLFLYCALQRGLDWTAVAGGVVPSLPDPQGVSAPMVIALIGGVGGSLTLLSYGYWMREKGWSAPEHFWRARVDLAAAYGLTALFGVAVLTVASGIEPGEAGGSRLVLALADELREIGGDVTRVLFLVGFWGAVFSSMLGVWQGVPYLFADWVAIERDRREGRGEDARELTAAVDTQGWVYRGYLLYLAIPPILLVFFDRPTIVIIVYSIVGALFMPFLAATLLVMNSTRRWVGELRHGIATKVVLVLALAVFGYLVVPTSVKVAGQVQTLVQQWGAQEPESDAEQPKREEKR